MMIVFKRRSMIISIVMVLSCCCCMLRPPAVAAADNEAAIQQKCSADFTKVYPCLGFATAKDNAPSSSCCGAVGDIRGKDPVCLCFIIQQTHDGNAAVKSLGLQFDRLLQLPAACRLANVSLSDCPKLLNLPANSPDNAIFTNTAKASSSPSTSSSPSAGSSNISSPSKAATHRVRLNDIFTLAVISAVFLCIFKGA